MTRKVSIWLTAMILFSSVSAAQQAQVAVNQVQIGGPLGMGVDEDELASVMKVEIDAIQRLTGISDSAVKKLEVAATAAVKNAVKNAPQARPMFGVAPQVNPAQPSEKSLSDEDEERKQKTSKPESQEANANGLPGGFPGLAFLNSDSVKKEEIWKKTLSNVLNAEQIKDYQGYQEERSKREREIAVQNQVSQMDSYLLLTSSQRGAMTKLIDQEQGEQLVQQRKLNGGMGGGMGNVIVMIAGGQTKPLSVDKLTEILSPVQLKEYKRQQDKLAQGPFGQLPGMPQPKKKTDSTNSGTELSIGIAIEETKDGLVVQAIKEDSIAGKAGVKVGDVIDSVNDTPVDTVVQLKRSLAKAGETWRLKVRRKGELVELQAGE